MSNLPILWVSLLLLALSPQSRSANVHIAHCFVECPEVREPNAAVVIRHLYAAAIDSGTGLPEWVAYRIQPGALGVASLLSRKWQLDRLVQSEVAAHLLDSVGSDTLPSEASTPLDSEYRRIGNDSDPESWTRLAPLTSFAGTPYWEELNYLSNMAALPTDLRLGSWARLEMAINDFARQDNELYVLTGTTPGPDQSYFKVIRSKAKTAVFVFAGNLPQHAEFCSQSSTLEALEALTGLELFPGLSKDGTETDESMLPDLGCSTEQGTLP